jgi:hypothetical protein
MAEWFEALDEETKAHATAKGWDKPLTPEIATAMIGSNLAAQKLMGVPPEHIVRMPRGADDPNFKPLYDRVLKMALPTDEAAYKFDGVKYADGRSVDEQFQASIKALAKEHNLTPATAEAIARTVVTRDDQSAGVARSTQETNAAAGVAMLHGAWGPAFDNYLFSATKAIEAAGLPASLMDAVKRLEPAQYVSAMDALRNLGAKMNESAYLAGDPSRKADPTTGMTPEQAQTRLNQLKADPAEAQKWIAGDTETRALFDRLTEIITGGFIQPQSAR